MLKSAPDGLTKSLNTTGTLRDLRAVCGEMLIVMRRVSLTIAPRYSSASRVTRHGVTRGSGNTDSNSLRSFALMAGCSTM